MKERQDKILTVLPAYNEEKHLRQVLEQVLEQTPDVLVVNDGSKDRTADIARECGVMLITRENNLGKGASLKEAFNRALELGYDAVIMLDSDGQHDPACIPEFAEKFHETRAPLIIGNRNYEEMPFRRRIPNIIGKALFSTAVGQEIPDNQSGYRLLDRVMMNRMLASNERGYHFEVEMIAICIAEGWPIEWVPIPTIYGDEISKQNPLNQLFGFPAMCLRARRMIREKRKKS